MVWCAHKNTHTARIEQELEQGKLKQRQQRRQQKQQEKGGAGSGKK